MMFNPSVSLLMRIVPCVFIIVFLYLMLDHWGPQVPSYSLRQASTGNEHAYMGFLAAPYDLNDTASDDEDHYYTQTRMLLYQLRHDPATRSPNNYPFVVLVTDDVSPSKRERLQREGAIVKRIEKLKPLQHVTRKAWQDQITKLRLFEQIEYKKILYLDSDHFLTRPMDGIFEDEAAQVQQNKNLPAADATKSDEAPQPATYGFASNAGSGGYDHSIPPRKGNNVNGGFILLEPSLELFNYYLSLTTPETEGRYNGRYNEQGVWQYAHRRNGNMPWMQVHWKWNINWATYKDYTNGDFASLHTKYWGLDHDPQLRDLLMRIKWKMEGFWEAHDAL